MAPSRKDHIVIVGAGAAGLMAAHELGRAGMRVTILEAQNRCGGRIYPLPAAEFGYPAEGGAEFVHGEAAVTHALLREAGLSFSPMTGTRWSGRKGVLSRDDAAPAPHEGRLYRALAQLKADLPIAEFLDKHFSGRKYEELRRSIKRMVEGYDAADPARASTLALRDEWIGRGLGRQGRIEGGYGSLIEFLATKSTKNGASIHLGTGVRGIEESAGGIIAHGGNGSSYAGDAAILTVPIPVLADITLPEAARAKAAATADIGYGNVVKLLLRFSSPWWAHLGGRDLADLSFLFSSAAIPTWWTQNPAKHWVLTGWFAGPKTEKVAGLSEAELVEMGLASLAETFDLPLDQLRRELVASRAIDWAKDPFARGAYSYATPETRPAQAVLAKADDGLLFFSGEALYRGRDMGTVEAALASGLETARMILALRE